MKSIGVIIPCFNTTLWLGECVYSVKRQDVAARIVIVDDGGDNPEIIDDRVAEMNVDVIHLPQNRGIGIARNIGAAYLNTDYFLFLDADDYLHQGAVNALLDALDGRCIGTPMPPSDFAYGNYSQSGAIIETQEWAINPMLAVSRLDRQNIASYCNLWRRDSFWHLGGYRDVPVAEDWELQKRAAFAGMLGAHADALIFEHRLHDANKWAKDSVEYGGLEGVSQWLIRQQTT